MAYIYVTKLSETRLSDSTLTEASSEGLEFYAVCQVITGKKFGEPTHAYLYTFRRPKGPEPATVDTGRSVAAAIQAHPRSHCVTHSAGGFR